MMQHFFVVVTLVAAAVDASNLRNGARRRAASAGEPASETGTGDVAFPNECANQCATQWVTILSELSLTVGPSGNSGGSPSLTDPGTLKPGCYESTEAFMLTSTLTLDDTSNSGEKFVFRTPAALNTEAGSAVILTNTDSEVIWCIEAAVNMGALTNFQGAVYAGAAITVGANANIGPLKSGAATTLGANVNVHGDLTAGAAVTLGANTCIQGTISTGAGMTMGAGQRSDYSAVWTDYATTTGDGTYPLTGKTVFQSECSDAADTVRLWAAADSARMPDP